MEPSTRGMPTEYTGPTVGLIGLGFMGHGMGHNLITKGIPLYIKGNRKREAIDDLVSKGAVECQTAGEMARECDVLLLCVPGAEQVSQLIEGEGGVLASGCSGLTIIDHTTSTPDGIKELADKYPQFVFVDAPLGRSPKEAWSGKLSVMVGADKDVLKAVEPILSTFADTIQYAGPLGSGHALKMVNNMVSLGYAALYSEALCLVKSSGLEISAFDDLISSSRMNCEFFQTFMGWVRKGDSSTHKFSLKLAEHTISDVQGLAEKIGLESELLQSITDVYKKTLSLGFEEENLPELPRAVAQSKGMALRPYKKQ